MDKPQTFEELQKQSEEYFRQQFDPSSQFFHNGSTEQVPTGGNRVPDLMYSMYPEGFDPNKPAEVVDYGEKYRSIEVERNTYQLLKKSLAKLCPAVQGFLRHRQIFKEKGNPTNEHHLKIHEQNMKKEQENLKSAQKELQDYIPTLNAGSEESQILAKQLITILQQSNKKYQNKQQLTNFNFKVKKLSTQFFSGAQKLLQQLKTIKKQYELKNKEPKEEDKQKTQNQEAKQ